MSPFFLRSSRVCPKRFSSR